MKERLLQWQAAIDTFGLRERIFLLLATIAILFLIIDSLVYQPAMKEQKRAATAISNLQLQMSVLEIEAQTLNLKSATEDPLQDRRHYLETVKARGLAMDATLQTQLGMVVEPKQAAQMLRDIIDREQDLTLMQLQTEVADLDDLTQQATDGTTSIPGSLGRYQLTLQLEGSFASAQAFLTKIENLNWALFTDELEITVTQHPKSIITLKLYTLGSYRGTV